MGEELGLTDRPQFLTRLRGRGTAKRWRGRWCGYASAEVRRAGGDCAAARAGAREVTAGRLPAPERRRPAGSRRRSWPRRAKPRRRGAAPGGIRRGRARPARARRRRRPGKRASGPPRQDHLQVAGQFRQMVARHEGQQGIEVGRRLDDLRDARQVIGPRSPQPGGPRQHRGGRLTHQGARRRIAGEVPEHRAEQAKVGLAGALAQQEGTAGEHGLQHRQHLGVEARDGRGRLARDAVPRQELSPLAGADGEVA